MARYDLPAMVSYALHHTGVPSLSYVGHSQGTIQAFAAFSRNQTLAAQVNYFAALAPVAYVDHTTVGTIHALADLDVGKVSRPLPRPGPVRRLTRERPPLQDPRLFWDQAVPAQHQAPGEPRRGLLQDLPLRLRRHSLLARRTHQGH